MQNKPGGQGIKPFTTVNIVVYRQQLKKITAVPVFFTYVPNSHIKTAPVNEMKNNLSQNKLLIIDY